MIYTVTLNPAIDLVVSCREFESGRINSYTDPVYAPGGKGINVSLVLSQLGVESVAMGFCGGFTGSYLLECLKERKIPTDFVETKAGNTRINLKISGEDETELNGKGPQIAEEEAREFLRRVGTIKEGDSLVLAGSLPASLPEDFYARILAAVPQGVKAVVDTTGSRLLECLRYRPFLVKPNHKELSEIFQKEITSPEEAAKYGKQLREMGARNVLVSMGSLGAVLVAEEATFGEAIFLPALKLQAVSPCGAGDSMVAGFLYGMEKGGTLLEAMRWGTAAGAATACSKGIASGEEIRRKLEETGEPISIK